MCASRAAHALYIASLVLPTLVAYVVGKPSIMPSRTESVTSAMMKSANVICNNVPLNFGTEHIELTLTAPDTVQHRNSYDLGKHTEQIDMYLKTRNALLKPVTIGKHGSGISEITKGMSEDCGWSQVSHALTYPEWRWYEWWHNIHHGRNNCLYKSCAHSQGLRTKRLADNNFDIMLSVPVWRHTQLTIGATAPPALGLAAALPRLYILAHGT